MLVFRDVSWLTHEFCAAGITSTRETATNAARSVRSSRPLRRVRPRSTGCAASALRPLTAERKQNRARSVLGKATRSLAGDLVGAYPAHAALEKPRPHASVDPTRVWLLHDERPQWAGGGFKDGGLSGDRFHRDLEAERSERITDPLQAGSEVSRRLQLGCGSQAASKVLARFSDRSLSAAGGNLPDQQADQLREAPVGEFNAFQLRRDAIDLGRPSSARSAPAAATLQREGQESGLLQPIEATARDVAVDTERRGDIVRGERIAAAAREEQKPAKLGIAGRCEAIERHTLRTYPSARLRVSVQFHERIDLECLEHATTSPRGRRCDVGEETS